MYNLLKKLTVILLCSVILMILVAAGVDETSIHMAESIGSSVQSVTGGYTIIIGLFSAWLLTVGAMCRTLKNIPGVQKKRSQPAIYKN